jgi:hypothetical protein
VAKQQFASTQRLIFPQGKWWSARAHHAAGKPNFNQDMWQRSRATYPGKAVPGRHCRDPFTFRAKSTACLHVFRWRKLVSLVLDLTPNSLESFIPFSSHLLRKQNYSEHPSSLANAKTAWWSAGTSWHLYAAIATTILWGTFQIWLYQHRPPREQIHPPLIIWAPAEGLRKCTARSYCTPCITEKSKPQLCCRSSPFWTDTDPIFKNRTDQSASRYGELPVFATKSTEYSYFTQMIVKRHDFFTVHIYSSLRLTVLVISVIIRSLVHKFRPFEIFRLSYTVLEFMLEHTHY